MLLLCITSPKRSATHRTTERGMVRNTGDEREQEKHGHLRILHA